MANRLSSCRIARLPRWRAAAAASLAASKARWLSGGYRWSCCQATVGASSGRIAPRGDDDPLNYRKVGRASVDGRVGLVVLSSNCFRFVWPRRSARQEMTS
jgi:hypothetical protein